MAIMPGEKVAIFVKKGRETNHLSNKVTYTISGSASIYINLLNKKVID